VAGRIKRRGRREYQEEHDDCESVRVSPQRMEFNAAKDSRMQLRGQTRLRLLRDATGEACAGGSWNIKAIPMGKRAPTEHHIGSFMTLAVEFSLRTHADRFDVVRSQASNVGGEYAKNTTGKRSVTASPEPKRAKSKESAPDNTAAKPTKAKTTKGKTAATKAAMVNTTEAARAGGSPKATRNIHSPKVRATKSALEDSSESDEDVPAAKALRSDPNRRQKAVQQALAGAAAAKAAAKRAENGVERTYNLRSASSNGSA
jgi:hypothetical protein